MPSSWSSSPSGVIMGGERDRGTCQVLYKHNYEIVGTLRPIPKSHTLIVLEGVLPGDEAGFWHIPGTQCVERLRARVVITPKTYISAYPNQGSTLILVPPGNFAHKDAYKFTLLLYTVLEAVMLYIMYTGFCTFTFTT